MLYKNKFTQMALLGLISISLSGCYLSIGGKKRKGDDDNANNNNIVVNGGSSTPPVIVNTIPVMQTPAEQPLTPSNRR